MTPAERTARWRESHPAENIRQQREYRQRLQQFVDELKSGPCFDCGRTYPSYVMDFDHSRGVKSANVSRLVANKSSREVILAEVAKCDLVCANCHRIRTHTRKE